MKTLKLILVLLLTLNLTGCWSKVELDELIFVFALYIDAGKVPGTVEVAISAPLTNRLMSGQESGCDGGSSKSKMYAKVVKTAETIPDALTEIQKDLTRSLSLAKVKSVVVGHKYAKQGIGDLLEWMRREPTLPLGTYLFTSPGQAQTITKLAPTFETLPSEVLMKFGQENYMLGTTIKECLMAEASGMGYALNYLSFQNSMDDSVPGVQEYWVGMQGASLFQKDRMKGTVGLQEAKALAWAVGHNNNPELSVKWDDGRSKASAIFFISKSSKSVRMTEKGPEFHITLKGRASLVYKKDAENRSKTAFSKEVREALERKAEKDLKKALDASQKAGTDVLQLGMLVEWHYPEEWKKIREQWDDHYKNHAVIKVDAQFRLADFGIEV